MSTYCALAYYPEGRELLFLANCKINTNWNLMLFHFTNGNDFLWYGILDVAVIVRFMGPTWGPSGADRTQVGPMLDPWTLLSGRLRGGLSWKYRYIGHVRSENVRYIYIYIVWKYILPPWYDDYCYIPRNCILRLTGFVINRKLGQVETWAW